MTFEIPSDVTAGLAQMERWNLGNSNVELSGTEEVMLNLSHILVVAEDAAMARLGLNAERILVKSQEQVPVDMTYERVSRFAGLPRSWVRQGIAKFRRGRLKGGGLKSTGTVEKAPEINGYRIGYNTPYAHRQHEDLTYRHTKPGAKAKYLEDPAFEIAPTIAADIVDALRGVLM